MSETRRASAAAFALEDELASPVESLHVAVEAPGSRGGPTIARVVDRATIDALAARRPVVDRVVAEPDLVARDGAWHWCADAEGRAFVRRPDGSAFATDAPVSDELPIGLAAALARPAGRAGGAPRVVVDAAVDPARFAAWSAATGAAFVAGTPWSLERVPSSAWAAAPDLRAGHATPAQVATPALVRRFAPAVALALAALALHVVATAAQWAHDRYAAWRADRATVELARAAGLGAMPDARAAERALAKRAAEALHGSARMADDDALPLIARAAAPLGALPEGTVRKLSYGDRRLVADLGAIDDARTARLLRELAAAGLESVAAPASGGVRVAATLGP